MGLAPLPIIDVTEVLPVERAALLALLAGLAPEEWKLPTECPAWTVQGVALHILGDDLSLLSRQRDGAAQGLILFGETHAGLNFRELLDGFNEQWVTAAQFLSPPLILTLLEAAGRWTADFYGGVDAELRNEPVGLFAVEDASPYWQISAREYYERWIHQHQIRRATGRADLEPEFLRPVGSVVAHMTAARARALDLAAGTTIVVEISGVGEWTIEVGAPQSRVFLGAPESPTIRVAIDARDATPILSRALTASEIASKLRATGREDLCATLTQGFALLAARP